MSDDGTSTKQRRVPSWLWLVLGILVGSGLATGLLFRFAQKPEQQFRPPPVRLLGKDLALTPQATTEALARLRQWVSGLFTIRLPDGQVHKVSFGDLGVELDKARLAHLLRDTVDATSPLSRWRRRSSIPAHEPVELPLPIRLNPERLWPLLRGIKDEYDRPAIDARLDLAGRKVIPSVEGLLLDLDASRLRLETALANGKSSAELAFEVVLPTRRTEQLNNVRFDHVIAAFETHYDRSAKAAARTYNLRLAASKLDGYVLLPGEIFDFNRVVGPRDEANGYRVAPVIAEGELVDGIGGGTCQISGTLHGAVFFAGLPVTERYPHTRPSSYIKLGLDATVVYPTINFRFQNPFDFPIVLHQTVRNGVVRAEVLGPDTEQTVTLIRRIEAAVPYEQLERDDPNLPRGERVLAQRGVPGFKVRMYRIVRNGPFAERERWLAQYPPTAQIVRVGTGTRATTRVPKDDPHPEYTADELLVVTLIEGNDGTLEMTEDREKGRFGEAGWTAKAGMPVFQSKE